MPQLAVRSATLGLSICAAFGPVRADDSAGSLSNTFTGDQKCLAAVGGDQAKMVPCTHAPSQIWDLMNQDPKRRDRFHLKNRATHACLDVINDGTNNELTLAACGDYKGQVWTQGGGRDGFRLTTDLTGSGKCLDIVNDDRSDKPIMSPCGHYSGQIWHMTGNS